MSKKLTELEKEKAALEEKQRAEMAKLEARLKQEKARVKVADRDKHTNRMVLLGLAMTQAATKDATLAERMQRELQAFLVRPRDRALFDLPVLQEAAQK